MVDDPRVKEIEAELAYLEDHLAAVQQAFLNADTLALERLMEEWRRFDCGDGLVTVDDLI